MEGARGEGGGEEGGGGRRKRRKGMKRVGSGNRVVAFFTALINSAVLTRDDLITVCIK